MNEKAKSKIAAVIRTLDGITISGKKNMDMLLGCMIVLEDVLNMKEEQNAGPILDSDRESSEANNENEGGS